MHIHKFADLCEFSEIGVNGTFEETQKYRQFLKNLHPRQILNMQISLALYQVVYSYTTIRGNYREGKKYFFANLGEHEELDIEIYIKVSDWIDEENRLRPYRAVSNVEILDISRVAYAILTASTVAHALSTISFCSSFNSVCWSVSDLVSSFGLNEKESLRSFSKGMQKQAYFILAVSTMPEILILDEPIDGLDPIVRKRVWSIIVDEVADRQMTVLVSSHNLREMEGVCDAIGIMKNGRVQIERDIDTLKTDIHKVQVAFTSEVYDPFKGLNVIHEDSRGSVKLIIAKNSFEEIEDIIGKNNPAVFDVLPLTLEEIFIYELGGGKDEQIFV